MFQRILVPLDGSLRAERALPLAARLARASQGMLILLRVVSAVAEDDPETPSQSLVMRTLAQTQMEEADRYLTALASSQALGEISLTVAALPGCVVSTIRTAIQTYKADFHFHGDNRPFFIAESETTQDRTGGVLLKEHESRVEKPIGGEDADLLALEMPAKPKRRAWILQENQRCGASEENLPLLIVPSPGAEYKEWCLIKPGR